MFSSLPIKKIILSHICLVVSLCYCLQFCPPEIDNFENIMGKGANALERYFLLFHNVFYPSYKEMKFFSHIYFVVCKCPQFYPVQNVVIWKTINAVHPDFSHLTELRNIYITKICMKKQYKSSIVKNHKITKKKKIFF